MKRYYYAFVLLALFAGGCAGMLNDANKDQSAPGIKTADAKKLLHEHKFSESIAAFRKIVDDYPNSDWAAKAIYSIATTYISSENTHKDYALALLHFEEFLDQYPQHERAAEAKSWHHAIKLIIDAKKENEHLLKNIEQLKQLDMRQEQKRLRR